MMKPDVVAVFEFQGKSFEDVNPLCRTDRGSGTTVSGVRPGNADRWTMHAEIAAMLQAYDGGFRGGHGVLRVSGVRICPWCKGDIKTLARALQLESLTGFDADGTVIEFGQASDLLPVRHGGKTWN
jgi:hypothetical protein